MKMTFMRALATLLGGLSLGTIAAPGDPDPTFGNNGAVEVDIGQSHDVIVSLLLRADGKLAAVGRAGDDIGLARYLPSGAPDTTFGKNGLARMRLPGGNARPIAAAGQADGKVLVLATCGDRPCLFRFDANGAHDPSLDASAALAAATSNAYAIAVQPDGKIVIAAYRWNGGDAGTGSTAVRLLPTGALDATFGDGGRVLVKSGFDWPTAVQVQPSDGRIVLTVTNSSKWTAVRLNTNGSIDTSFQAPSLGGEVRTLALQPDGRIVAAGCPEWNPPAAGAGGVWRLTASGTPDPSFGNGGVAVISTLQCVAGVAAASDGSLALSTGSPGGRGGSRAVRLLANGSPDNTFGVGGQAQFNPGGPPQPGGSENDQAAAVVVQPDGKIVAGGNRWGRDFALQRYASSGASDSSFGNAGVVTSEFMGARSTAGYAGFLGVRRVADKYLVVVTLDADADFGGPPLDTLGMARVLADGSMDPTFGTGGQTTLPASADAFSVLPDGSIVLAVGTLGSSTNIRRVLPDGTPDGSFGTGGVAAVPGVLGALASLPDGRFVVTARAFNPSPARLVVARFMPNGTPDPGFASGGIGFFAQASYPGFLRGSSIAAQPDGRLVIGEVSGTPFSAMRLMPDGTLDPTFGSAGIAAFPPPHEDPYRWPLVSSTLVHADGRITLVGDAPYNDTVCGERGTHAVAFARMNAAGFADASTPGAGYLAGVYKPVDVVLKKAALDGSDRVVATATKPVGCIMDVSGSYSFPRTGSVLMRFTPMGALDTGFGEKGMVTLVGSPQWQSFASEVSVEPDGKLLTATSSYTGYSSRITLHRLLGGGSSGPTGTPGDVDGDGIPNTAELAAGRDPFVRDNDVMGDARLFAMQQYRDFLGREGDAGGVDFWAGQLAGAQSRAQMVESFFNSNEFQGTVAPVARLYFAYFLRIPDYAGLGFWIGYYRGGNSLEAISNQFAGSGEFQSMYGALDNGQFVNLAYQNVLGRAADPGGLAYWKGQLDSSAMTRGQVMLGFSESPEYRSASDSMVYVTMMYAGMLRRPPDPGGFDYWVGYRNAGNSGLALINAFLASPEYRDRFLP